MWVLGSCLSASAHRRKWCVWEAKSALTLRGACRDFFPKEGRGAQRWRLLGTVCWIPYSIAWPFPLWRGVCCDFFRNRQMSTHRTPRPSMCSPQPQSLRSTCLVRAGRGRETLFLPHISRMNFRKRSGLDQDSTDLSFLVRSSTPNRSSATASDTGIRSVPCLLSLSWADRGGACAWEDPCADPGPGTVAFGPRWTIGPMGAYESCRGNPLRCVGSMRPR